MARKILLADDSVTAQNMGRKILADAGYEVITVNNGSAALKRIAEHKPDLVVLDVYMPGYSGLEVCQRLKEAPDTAHIPVLLTVGKLEPFKAEDARRVNADAFIVKPFEASELMGVLARLEDSIVPQAAPSRFSTTVSGIERFVGEAPRGGRSRGGAESDTGWKSRIRFPVAKPKGEAAEPEVDYLTPRSFRDQQGGPATAPTPPTASARVTESPVAHEPGLVPEIPRDITPDELDALSALVVKLDGPIPQAEEIAPLAGKVGSSATPAETEAMPAQVEAAAEGPAGPIPTKCEPEVPAPVDRDDEPLFALAPMAMPEVAAEPSQDQVEAVVEAKSLAEPPQAEAQVKTEDLAQAEHLAQEDQPKPEEVLQNAAVAAVPEEAVASWEQAPTEAELTEALRLLTPSHDAVSEPAGMRAAPEAEEAVAVAATTAAVETVQGAGTRWVAEAVSLSLAEAALSLEGEMLGALAIPSGTTPGLAAVQEIAPVPASEEVPATAVAEAAAPAGTTGTREMAASAAAEESRANPQDSRAIQVEKEQEEPAAATFVRHSAGAEAASAVEGSVPAREETPAGVEGGSPAAESQASSEAAAGGEESMGKEGKTGKAGKSGWHQIRATPAPAAATMDVVEAKQAEPQAEEAPRAMAAAAAADGEAASTSAADASTIASIVDSVLADLRPKIVEEIAKKLGRK